MPNYKSATIVAKKHVQFLHHHAQSAPVAARNGIVNEDKGDRGQGASPEQQSREAWALTHQTPSVVLCGCVAACTANALSMSYLQSRRMPQMQSLACCPHDCLSASQLVSKLQSHCSSQFNSKHGRKVV